MHFGNISIQHFLRKSLLRSIMFFIHYSSFLFIISEIDTLFRLIGYSEIVLTLYLSKIYLMFVYLRTLLHIITQVLQLLFCSVYKIRIYIIRSSTGYLFSSAIEFISSVNCIYISKYTFSSSSESS